MRTNKFGLLVVTTLLLSCTGMSLLAQAAPATPGGGGRGQGQRGQGRGQMSLGNLSVSTINMGLKLTAAQKTSIQTILDKRDAQIKALPALTPPAQGEMPTPEQQQAMRDGFQKRQELNTAATEAITAVLTDDQKKALPDFLKEVGAMQQAGLPAGVLGDLKLTEDQKKSITAQAEKSAATMREKMQAAQQSGQRPNREEMMAMRKESTDAVMALLTPTQKAMVEKYVKDHPQPAFGGFGGRRGGNAGGN